MFKQVMKIIDRSERKKFVALLIMMFFGSFLEILGISVIVSVISLMLQPDILTKNKLIGEIYSSLGFVSQRYFIVFIILLMVFVYIFKTVYLIFEYYLQSKFVKGCQHNTAMKLLDGIIHRPYEYFTGINVADVTRTVYDDVNQFSSCLYAYLQLLTETIVVVCLIIYLFYIDFKISFFLLCAISVLLVGIKFLIRKKVYKAGKVRQKTGKERLKWLNQTIYGIKDIKIGQNEQFFYDKYKEADIKFVKAEILYQFWTKAPSYCIEALMMICILILLLVLTLKNANIVGMVPSLTAFAFAAAKLLPAGNHLNSYFTQISYTKPSLELVYKELTMAGKLKSDSASSSVPCSLGIGEGISANNIDFSYIGSESKVLEGAQIKIPKGMAVGIIGESGSGKTTIVDILLGLLKPQSGEVLIDSTNIDSCYSTYLERVAYIPQMTFLLDDTIRNNVAFGVEPQKIDDNKVWEALNKAQLKEFVETLPEKLNSQVGERGVRLSGGQRQRIGIARALFDACDILVFDEATSALDGETESAIMESIRNLKGEKTLIIIAHRLSTIADCDIVYIVEGQKIHETSLDM